MPKSKKLAILVVLEEYAISWDELFTKDRPSFKSIIRWKVFRALRDEGMSLGEIARICDVDHTSVIHGLRKVSSEDLK
jgi:chromosomal replication initiation ATPase DnaA